MAIVNFNSDPNRKGAWSSVAAIPGGYSDDGLFYYVDDAALTWERITEAGMIDATAAGIYDNGADTSTAFQAAMNHTKVKILEVGIRGGGNIVVNGTVNCNGKELIFKDGTKITGTGTLTNFKIAAGIYQQCFDITLTVSNVTLTSTAFSVYWYGAKADYNRTTGAITTDSRAAINKTFSILNGQVGKENIKVHFPKGDYSISDMIFTPDSCSYFRITGDGMYNTRIYWNKPTDGGDVLKLLNAQHGYISDISFFGKQGANGKPDKIINVHRFSPHIGTDGMIGDVIFERIYSVGHLGPYKRGLVYTCAGANDSVHDQNNEQGTIRDCYFEVADEYGISFEHQNSLWHRIEGGRCSGNIACINTLKDDGTGGGGFNLDGTVTMALLNTSVLFRLSGSQYPYSIINAKSEGDGKILYARNGTEGRSVIVDFHSCHFKVFGDPPSGDHFDVDCNSTSLINVVHSYFIAPSGVRATIAGGCSFQVYGGVSNLTAISYSGKTMLDSHYSSAGITYTNLGGGTLYVGDLNKGQITNYKTITAPATTTLVADGYKFFEMQYSAPTTITAISGGHEGQEIFVYAGNGNVSLGPSVSPTGVTTALPNGKVIKYVKLGAAFGGNWTPSAYSYEPTEYVTITANNVDAVHTIAINRMHEKSVIKSSIDITGFKIGSANGVGDYETVNLTANVSHVFDGTIVADAAQNIHYSGIVGTGANVTIKVKDIFP